MLQTGELYRDPGGDYFTRQNPDRTTRRLVRQLEALGHHVTLESREVAVRRYFASAGALPRDAVGHGSVLARTAASGSGSCRVGRRRPPGDGTRIVARRPVVGVLSSVQARQGKHWTA